MEQEPRPIRPGQMVPDFSLPSTSGRPIRISDFRQRSNLVLVFVAPADREAVRPLFTRLQAARGDFSSESAELLAVLPAPLAELERLKDEAGLEFPLLSDERGLTHRFLLDDAADPRTSIYIADRYGEIYTIQRLEAGAEAARRGGNPGLGALYRAAVPGVRGL